MGRSSTEKMPEPKELFARTLVGKIARSLWYLALLVTLALISTLLTPEYRETS